ncbi:MAG: universal stress protein [Halobacteriaceae archaeon]
MATHVLVLLDESDQAWRAFEHARDQFPDAELTLLHVIDPLEAGYGRQASPFGVAEEWYERQQEAAEDLFDRARDAAGDREVETQIEVGRPSRTAVEFTDDHDVDHIVLGSHGRSGVSRILLGSVAETVVRRSPVPVTVVR